MEAAPPPMQTDLSPSDLTSLPQNAVLGPDAVLLKSSRVLQKYFPQSEDFLVCTRG